jgi:hypothetical protein
MSANERSTVGFTARFLGSFTPTAGFRSSMPHAWP